MDNVLKCTQSEQKANQHLTYHRYSGRKRFQIININLLKYMTECKTKTTSPVTSK